MRISQRGKSASAYHAVVFRALAVARPAVFARVVHVADVENADVRIVVLQSVVAEEQMSNAQKDCQDVDSARYKK